MKPALFDLLRAPEMATKLTSRDWNQLIRKARKEALLGTVGRRLVGLDIPPRARALLDEAERDADLNQKQILFELQKIDEALAALGVPIILMKGAAYLVADLPPIPGRHVGDVDIMVPKARLREVEAALKRAGWRSVKASGSYDDEYYRSWMHELPPLAHRRRGHVVDLHHTILPVTARLTPDADAIFARAVPAEGAFKIMAPEDMLLHAAVHFAYDGDFLGGARNAWDIDRLTRHFGALDGFWQRLEEVACAQQLSGPLARALRLAKALYGTPSPPGLRGRSDPVDWLARRKMTGGDLYARSTTPVADFLLFCRVHWLRMPPARLAQHLTTKWQARRREAQEGSRTRRPLVHRQVAHPPAGPDSRSGTE